MRARSGEPSLRNDICYLDTTRVPPVLFKADFFKPHPSENEDNTNLRSQFVTANYIKKQRFYPYAFSEIGVAMLSSVLKSEVAIEANRKIMKAFIAYRPIGFIQPKEEDDDEAGHNL